MKQGLQRQAQLLVIRFTDNKPGRVCQFFSANDGETERLREGKKVGRRHHDFIALEPGFRDRIKPARLIEVQ